VTAACSPDERAARAALCALAEPGTLAAVRVARAVRDSGPVSVLALIRTGAEQLDPDLRMFRRALGVDGAEVLRQGLAAGARFLCPGDADWPGSVDILEFISDAGSRQGPPPLGLWVRGNRDLAAVTERSVAIVGARAATEYGLRVAADLAADLATAEWAVVSGAAYGIDAAAHRGALAVGGTTVGVLACGVDTAYPRGHAGLLHRIAENGIVVSELSPGSRPSRLRFLARNRLIAAMTRATVVVEAAVRSGALNTAGWALDVGRDVLAVPGPVTSALSAGCHDLVRKSAATLVTDAREVIDMVGDLGIDAADDVQGEPRPWDALAPIARDVLEAMPARKAVTVDTICRGTGLEPAACIAALAELSVAGLVGSVAEGWQLARRGGA
jgi:DNA processing protein